MRLQLPGAKLLFLERTLTVHTWSHGHNTPIDVNVAHIKRYSHMGARQMVGQCSSEHVKGETAAER